MFDFLWYWHGEGNSVAVALSTEVNGELSTWGNTVCLCARTYCIWMNYCIIICQCLFGVLHLPPAQSYFQATSLALWWITRYVQTSTCIVVCLQNFRCIPQQKSYLLSFIILLCFHWRFLTSLQTGNMRVRLQLPENCLSLFFSFTLFRTLLKFCSLSQIRDLCCN